MSRGKYKKFKQLWLEGKTSSVLYGLLLREEYPGWLYEVNRGATTIWERWNSIELDGEMNRDGMNSFKEGAGCFLKTHPFLPTIKGLEI